MSTPSESCGEEADSKITPPQGHVSTAALGRWHDVRTTRHVCSMPFFVALVLCIVFNAPAFAQNSFSCPYGRSGACLGYGDRVVDQGSVCFSQFTCDFKGFVCKSKLEDVVDEYRKLVGKFNDLRDEYNDVADKNRELLDAATELLDKNKRLRDELEEAENKRDEAMREHQSALMEISRLGSELEAAQRRRTKR